MADLQEVTDLEAKYKLTSADLADRVAALQANEIPSLTRRPKRTSPYEQYKKVPDHLNTRF